MPSLSTSLPQLRETLTSLESYELPDKYKQISPPLSSSSSSPQSLSQPKPQPQSIIDPKLFQRYLKAKDSYLRKRMNHLFIQHLSSIQYNNNTDKENVNVQSNVQITLPEKPSREEIQELNEYKQRVTCELLNNMQNIRSSYDGVHQKYKLLNDKKDDIRNIIMTLENQQQKRKGKGKQGNGRTRGGKQNGTDTNDPVDNASDYDDDDDDVDDIEFEDENDNELDQSNCTSIQESELELEEERLQTLRQRKAMLEAKLHKLQMEKELVKNNIEKDQQLVKDLVAARSNSNSNSNDGTASSGSSSNSSGSNSNSNSNSSDGNSNSKTINGDTNNADGAQLASSFDIASLPSIEEIQIETQKIQDQVREYQDMAEYYDSIKCAMEVIGGMKILSITPVLVDATAGAKSKKNVHSYGGGSPNSKSSNKKNDHNIDNNDVIMSSPYSSPSTSPTKENIKNINNNNNTSPSNHSVGGPRKAGSLKKLSPPSKNRRQNRQLRHQSSPLKDEKNTTKSTDSINLKVLLLDYHVISLILTSNISYSSASSAQQKQQNQQQQNQQPILNYRVSSAQFETSTVISDTMHEEEHENNNNESSTSPVISMTIPPLDDLVTLSNNLKPLHDIQFILREAMARIRIISQRVDELAQLRLKYLTKITNPMKNKIKFGYGGEYQEVICSLPCQVTVVLRLTCDCPLLDGSVYIHQIVGVGGWDAQCLERMKKKVNTKKWRSPIQVMDSLGEEIRRVVKDEGICLPKTPTFPQRKKK